MTRTKSLPLEDYRKGQEELGNWRVEQLAKLETTPEFQIIARLVEEADSNLMVTVQQFFELTALNRDLGTIGAHCSRTSSALLALSSRTSPEKQAKLISFVVELKKETILNLQTGEPIRYQQDCDFVWTDLPTFGSASSDELHDRCMSICVQLYPRYPNTVDLISMLMISQGQLQTIQRRKPRNQKT